MDCTIIYLSHEQWIVQWWCWYTYPMPYGLYNSINSPWPMGCTICIYPMLHELYNIIEYIDLPCYMGCTTVYSLHGRWIAQHYDCFIGHGLYNSMSIPWPMDCITHLKRLISHVPWVVQHIWTSSSPMHHGLYNSIFTPLQMDYTIVYASHSPWVVQ